MSSGFADRQGWGERLGSDHPIRRILGTLLALVLVAGIVLAGLHWAAPDPTQPSPVPPSPVLLPSPTPSPTGSLPQLVLTGDRSDDPIDFVFLIDFSGSFKDYDQMRRDALQQVLKWAPANLRDDDTFTVISFATGSVVTMSTTTVADIAAGSYSLSQTAPLGSGTNIIPGLALAEQTLASSTRQTSIVVLTDTAIADPDVSQIGGILTAMNVTSVSVILPTGMQVEQYWAKTFPTEAEFWAHSTNTQEIAVAVGEALAHGTGQHLQ